jgi:hypothetical protein
VDELLLSAAYSCLHNFLMQSAQVEAQADAPHSGSQTAYK